MTYKINVSKHSDVAGCMNIEETRKTNIDEYLHKDYADIDTRVRVVIHEIFIDIIEKGLNSRNKIILIFDADIDILNKIEHEFDQWDIDVETI